MNIKKKMLIMAQQNMTSKSVHWNQLVSSCHYNSAAGEAAVYDGGYYKIYYKGSGFWRFLYHERQNSTANDTTFIDGTHIYAVVIKAVIDNIGSMSMSSSKKSSLNLLGRSYGFTASAGYEKEVITTPITGYNTGCYLSPAKTDDGAAAIDWEIRINVRLHDLTLMFGAGNEPATVEEFYERIDGIPVDINAYNPGEVIEW